MKLLTFLGAGKYSQTNYTLGDKQHFTCYCPAAVAHFYKPETTLVVVTEQAEQMHFEALADEISSVTTPVAIPIPDGKSEAELWGIFEALTKKVENDDDLVVDITYGFRSLPFLSFLAITFLRLARRVNVRHVYYGAWDARNKESNESPIFDLTPFVTLLDWTIATDRFTRFGDASDMGALLREGIPPGHLMGTDLQARELGNALKLAASNMEMVSSALRMTRPLETMVTSKNLVDTLERVGALVEQNAQPFGILADQMRQAYQPLVLKNPLNRENWQINLEIQLELIGWYLDKGQVVQAMTLAREWLVSVLVYHFEGESLIEYKAVRLPVEYALNNEAERLRGGTRLPQETIYEVHFQALPNHEEIGKLWNQLGNLRNDIAHVGMKPNPVEADALRKNAHHLYPRLQALAESLEIIIPNHNQTTEIDE